MATLTDRADYWAEQFGVPKDMYRRLITQESNWSPTAKSHAGAYGLSQAMPDTARQPGYKVRPLTDLENPDEQLRFGAEYLSAMMREYGDPTDALMAYNWGSGNFDDWVKAGRDPNAVPTETRNYVNVINPDRIKATYLKDGTMTNDSLRGMVEGALDDATRQEMLARQNGGVPGMPSGVVDPAQSVEATAQNQGLLAKLMPGLSDADRKQNLLAIGAGLLSGTDWQSGAALAGQNLFGVGSERQQRDALLAAKSNQAPEFQRIGTVTMPNGERVGGASYDPTTAQFFTLDENGQRRVLPGAHPTNNSDAIGSRYATQAAKTAEQVKELRGTLSSIDKILPNLDDVKYGAPGLLTDLKGFVKTMSGRMELSEEEILRRVVSGQTQGLIGKVREDVVGPGVMTENDALRVLAALGGDATKILGNPEVARRMLGEIHERTYKRYKEAHAQYDAYRDYPGIPFVDIEAYELPNIDYSGPKGSAPAGGVDDILKNYNL